MKPEIAYSQSTEGIIASVTAGQSQFSFRIGRRPTSVSEVGGAHLWCVEEGERKHVLQLVTSAVSERAIESKMPHDQILISHMQWEAGFQQERLQRKMIHSGLGHFPTGEPYLLWAMEGAPAADSQATERATGYSCNATTFHDGLVVLFGIQGLGNGWEDLALVDLKCSRAVLSMFRHSAAFSLPFHTPEPRPH